MSFGGETRGEAFRRGAVLEGFLVNFRKPSQFHWSGYRRTMVSSCREKRVMVAATSS